MKPVEVADADGEIVRVDNDPERPEAVWFVVPRHGDLAERALVFDHLSARALGYALLSAADKARFPKPEQLQK